MPYVFFMLADVMENNHPWESASRRENAWALWNPIIHVDRGTKNATDRGKGIRHYITTHQGIVVAGAAEGWKSFVRKRDLRDVRMGPIPSHESGTQLGCPKEAEDG